MSCSRHLSPGGGCGTPPPGAPPPDGPGARIRRLFNPSLLLRASRPANDNPRPASPPLPRRFLWFVLLGLGALTGLLALIF